MSKRRKMIRRRKVTVSLSLLMLMSIMMNYAAARRGEPEIATVVVKRGESVWSIAKDNNPNRKNLRKHVYDIIDRNSISDGVIYVGQELDVPLN